MRGFIATVIAVTLGLLLVLQVAVLRDADVRFNQVSNAFAFLPAADSVFQAVGEDLHRLTATTVRFHEDDSSVRIYLQDTVPKSNFTTALNNYAGFLGGSFQSSSHATLFLNASNLTSGTFEIFLLNRYVYTNSYANATLRFLPRNADLPGVYEINLTVPKARALLTPDFESDGGPINFTVRYSDNNGTQTWSGQMEAGDRNEFEVVYGDATTLNFTLGRVGSEDAALLVVSDAGAVMAMAVTVPPPDPEESYSYLYPVFMNYTLGNYSKATYVKRMG